MTLTTFIVLNLIFSLLVIAGLAAVVLVGLRLRSPATRMRHWSEPLEPSLVVDDSDRHELAEAA